MIEKNAGVIALEEAILQKIAEREKHQELTEKHKKTVSRLDKEIRDLKAGHKALTGKALLIDESEKKKPVLDWVEDILREKDPDKKGIHVDLLIELLAEKNIISAKSTVAAGLIRFHNQDKRFIRKDKNTFALR